MAAPMEESLHCLEHNLRHCHAKFEAQARDVENQISSEPAISTRSSTPPIDLSKCFICGNRSYKKDKRLLNIATNEASLSLRQAAISKGDEKMLRLLDSSLLGDPPSTDRRRIRVSPCKKKEDERRILSIAQDIIHCASNARTKLPKHISLAMTVHHLTGSKQLVSILNRMGHSSSYDDLKAVDTSLAMEVMARAEQHGTVVPSFISPGAFVQLAADNNDLNEETLDGKNTTHATTMVVYQRKVFGPDPPPIILADHSSRRRSLPESTNLYELLECPCYGRRPALNEHIRKVKNEWFSSELDVLVRALREDEIWLLLRMYLTERTPAAVMKQTVSGWSGFNTILYPDLPLSSKIGYCPMMDGASTEFSTVYTVLKHAQKISAVACQEDTVITFDLAIYIKAKQIQLRYPEEFANTVTRLRGFHIALNFLPLLGKKFASSGLDDLLIESGVYAAGTTSALLKGKSYNRGIRAHKLPMEALHRMMWSAYAQWCKDCEDSGLDEKMISRIEESREAILSRDNTSQNLEVLECDIEKLAASLGKFKEEASLQSKTFDFWMRYMSMFKLLLQFIKAE
ncbi:predicted protein [Nematostella vectensis]|uniref:Uncharacterized protein n=1 Tax=Nematostella vectensis TaxID=45351 RepID=A7SKP5_NEMVE|nr:predicted protein [Nematostella vectensis]|eukprot:XP_001627806.1 predicted protein [Nematostella vectensis]